MSELQGIHNEIAQLKQEMQNEIAQLKQENLSLKSKGKAQTVRQRCVLGLAVIGLGLALMTHNGNTKAAANQRFNSITTREIKVVDADNNVVLWLSPTKDGEGNISVYNSERKRIINISATTDTGSGIVTVADEAARPMVSIGNKDYKGYLWTQK